MIFTMTGPSAFLGPVSAEEEAALLRGGGGFDAGSIHSPGNVYDANNCSPGGPVEITNVSAAVLPNGSVTVTFSIEGGANGAVRCR